MGLSKNGASVYALSMFIQYSNYIRRVPNASSGLIFRGLYSEEYLGWFTGGVIIEGLIFGILRYCHIIDDVKRNMKLVILMRNR